MHPDDCECDLCYPYTDTEREQAIDSLMAAVAQVRDGGTDATADELAELSNASVVNLDAGFAYPVPAVVFAACSRLRRLKAAYTCRFLLDTPVGEVALALLSNMREHWSIDNGESP